MKKILIISICFLIVILGYSVYINNFSNQNIKSDEQQVFSINSGESKEIIINNLVEKGLIDSKFYTKYLIKKNDVEIYAGDFGLSEAMTDKEVLGIISNPVSNIDTAQEFLITEGSTLVTIAENLSLFFDGKYTSDEILTYWSNPENLEVMINNYDFISTDILNNDIIYPLEGYFFPATYKISDDATIEQVTKLFLDTMEDNLSGFSYKQGDLHKILTLASIVERETLIEDDKPIAAGVFYNRISQGVPLQSDITVLYAKQEHKEQVLYADLEFDSPYNTYLNSGLPPGPISTVSIASIDAVINPDNNDYMYFFADQNTGELYFSKTLEEHETIASEHAWQFSN